MRKLILFAAALTALAATQVAIASSPAVKGAVARTSPSKKQPVTLGFEKGRTVRYYDFGPIKLEPGNKLAPIWTFTNGAQGQRNIIDTVPGDKDYTPLWQVNKVTWATGKTPRVLTSAADVRQAAADGDLSITQTATVVNCPVLGFSQKKIAGFSAGHVIHYYDLGPAKVAPGNAVLTLYTFTNGTAGQHNVTRDTIAPGQTAYPPLWAQAAGQLSLKNASLVVNCPLVL